MYYIDNETIKFFESFQFEHFLTFQQNTSKDSMFNFSKG